MEVATRRRDADADAGGEPWATVVPDETYRHHSALAAIVVALGDAGGFHVDDIAIDVEDIAIEVGGGGTSPQGGAG